jgi:hypothetical protein
MRRTGAPRVAQGVGGLGASATVMQIIGGPNSTAKSSIGYRVSEATNKGVIGATGQVHQSRSLDEGSSGRTDGN